MRRIVRRERYVSLVLSIALIASLVVLPLNNSSPLVATANAKPLNFIPPVTGLLTGSQTAAPSSVNLTTEGSLDWAHWGLNSAADFDHRSGGTAQISNYSVIGSNSALRQQVSPTSYSWSNGTPTASASNTASGVFVYGLNNGLQITVPADTTTHTLKLYMGVWSAQGRLTATLSDGSAASWSDTSVSNQTSSSNAVFTINFNAASNGQTLTITWIVNTAYSAYGNVTMQAATLVGPPPANQAPTVNAGNDQVVSQSSGASLSGSAADDGLPNPPGTLTTTWSQLNGPGTVTFTNGNALNTAANFSATGVYDLRLTVSDSLLSSFDDVRITVNGAPAGGLLTGNQTAAPSSVNLTTEGSLDWAHWGLNSTADFNHRSGGTAQISNYSVIGSNSALRQQVSPTSYSWSNGTPTASASNTASGVFVYGLNNGLQITVPADTTTHTLKLYMGVWSAQGRLTATLSDGSAASWSDTSVSNQTSSSNAVFTINFNAASNGQTLTITWIVNTAYSAYGNVTMQAATLVGPPPANQAPTVNAGNDQVVSQSSGASLSGSAADDGLPNPPGTLTTTWSQLNGPGTVTFTNGNALNTAANFSATGVYDLRLTVSDSLLSSFDDVRITVNGAPAGGLLTGSQTAAPSSVNLTTEGSLDWAHWGLNSTADFNHRSGGTAQISNYSVIGSNSALRQQVSPTSYSWSNGTPTASASNTASGVFVYGLNNGLQITVPADTTTHTLKLYMGVWSAQGRLTATLSDGSAASWSNTSVSNQTSSSNAVFTINFNAASNGQTLTITWIVNTAYSAYGNVTMQAATLVGPPPAPTPTPTPTPTPVNSEFQISSSAVPYAQLTTNIASNSSGNSVVVWQSQFQDGSGFGIFARRYNAAGQPQGAEFQVNTVTANDQFVPRTAMDSAGNFVIAWESDLVDGSSFGIAARRFNSTGVPLGPEFVVNTNTADSQSDCSIAMSPAGDFVITWTSANEDGSLHGVYAQRYNAAGAPQGSQFRVNSYTNDMQGQSNVSMDQNGNFVVVWQSNGQDGSGYGIYGQRYDNAGVPQGTEFRVNATTANDQLVPSVAVSLTGEFVITWTSDGQDGSSFGIFGRRFNAAGVAQGSEFQVNTFTAGIQVNSSIVIRPNNEFVIVWESEGQDGDGKGIFGRRYNSSGTPFAPEFQVNTYTQNNQVYPFISISSAGFFITWTSSWQDGDAQGVYGKRYDSAGNPLPVP